MRKAEVIEVPFSPTRRSQGPSEFNTGLDAFIAKLSQMSPLEYDRERDKAADELGVRVSTLDKEVERRRPKSEDDDNRQGRSLEFPDPEPWPDAVNPADLLDEIVERFRRHVIVSPEQADAVALWIVTTWVLDALDHATRLAIVAPEKGSGKTTALDVLEPHVRRGLMSGGVSSAAVARVMEAHRPTLLIDEMDTFVHDAEGLVGVLNQGHRRGGQVIKCVGDDFETRVFSVFGHCALACNGSLPGTLEDRSIPIEMRRATAAERPQRIGRRDREAMAITARKCRRFAQDQMERLKGADPELPDWLSNRQADNWRGLVAVAELAGGDWYERALSAASALSGSRDHERASIGVKLLDDIRDILVEKGANRISSEDLCRALIQREDRPWSDWKGKPLTKAGLASLLRGFKIGPSQVRFGVDTFKGYLLEQFSDAFARYLPPYETKPRNNLGSPSHSGRFQGETVSDVPDEVSGGVSDRVSPFCDRVSAENGQCFDVSDVWRPQ